MEDLSEALGNPDHQRILGSGHCSALIKLLPANKDIYIAQDTWNGYESMLRVLKKYDFAFTTKPGNRGSSHLIKPRNLCVLIIKLTYPYLPRS